MASRRKLALLCVFVVGAVAGPVLQKEQCARHCTEEDDFSLRPGSTYTYDYETTTSTTVQGSSQDKTQLQLTAQVDIEVLSKCDLSLRLRGVNLKLSDPESPDYLNALRGGRDFARSVEGHILRFSFQNGKVEHVCPTENAPAWVTNIHKGVLSAFQTYMVQPDWSTRTLETDILGKCTAEYHSLGRSWQGTHTIRKLKDLSSCTDRENVETYFQGTPYVQDFQTRSLPLVKGNQECEQVIGQGILQSSTCNEKLVFRPFSNGGSGVVTTVVQKLTYATTSQRSFTGNDYRPTTETLLFRHVQQNEKEGRKEQEAENTLRDLCDASKQDVSISVPGKFSAFVYKLKKLPLASLKNFYLKVDQICPGNVKGRKFFMDAIPLVATSDSARFMYDMISRNVISEAESSFWLTSLSFVSEPTADIIAAFTPLLDGRHEQALLGVSALIHTFCKSHDCSRVREVQSAVYKLVENLGDNCYSPEDKKIIMTLKAISNIGIFYGKENTIEACYKNPQIRIETRIAAIQAFRRVSCDVSREELLQIYRNYNEDTEIRIAAYLAVMSCPTPSTVQAIKDVLTKERINHVGSFVWTHLTALAKSKHPERQDIREIVSNLYFLNKFSTDARKFSTAHEATFFLESIDSGFHIDSHLIYSTDSYLPRTAMFNLTVDIFGKTCNLFQVDGRVEGLEHVAESFFGPSGYFPQKNIAKMLREKRSVSYNRLNEMDEQFQAKSRFQQYPYGSLDVKIFGTSLWYNQFKENEDGSPDINLLEIVTKLAEEREKEYSRSFMFLDTTFTVPMTSGLPLRIAVNGTASVGLKIGGKFDVKSFEHVDVLGHIEPSGAIEIASLLTVEAGTSARSGLRVVGTMHSSTVLDGQLEIRNGEVVKAKLNMPRDRIDVFNMQSKLYLVHGPEEREQKIRKKDGTHLNSCTGEWGSKIFGVKLCSELRLPAYKPNTVLHPINGPAKFNIYIQKTDPKLKSYNFDAQWKKEEKNGAYIRYGMLSFDTPDSQVDRDLKMEIYLNQADRTATLKIKTPVKRLGVNAKLVNENLQKKFVLGLTVDDKDYFSMQSELRIAADKESVTYTPFLEVRIPTRRLVAVSGSAYMRHGQRYTGQLQVEDLTETPVLIKGNVEMGKQDRYEGEFTVNSFALDGTVKGFAQLGSSMSSRITAEYKFLEGKTNKINIVGKMRNLSANALIKYSGLMNVQTSVLPEWNTEIQFETMKTTGHFESTMSVSLGDGVRSRVHTIKLQEIIKYEGNVRNNKVSGTFALAYPEKSIDYALNMEHENSERSLKNTMKIQYATNKEINTVVQFNANEERPLSLSGGIKVKYPGRDAALSADLREVGTKEYRAVMTGQWQEGKRATITVNYKDRNEGSRMKYEVDGELQLPDRTPIMFSSTVGSQKSQYVGMADLNMGSNKYSLKADLTRGNDLNHRFSGRYKKNNEIYGVETTLQLEKNKISSTVEVKIPHRRRITAKLDGRLNNSIKTGQLEVLWDADKDTSKRFSLITELLGKETGYDGKFALQIRRRSITGALSTQFEGELYGSQWQTENKVELQWSPTEKAAAVFESYFTNTRAMQHVKTLLNITTPYNGYEKLVLSFLHDYANQQWANELSVMLPKRNEATLSSNGKFSFIRGGATIETTGEIRSSYAPLEKVSLQIGHNHNSKELTSKAQFNWARGKNISVQVTGVKQPSLVRGGIEIKSPFYYFQDLSAEVSHNFAVDNYESRGVFQWGPRKKIELNTEATHVLSGRRRICTVVIVASTPFQGYENTGSKITYSNDGVSLNLDTEVTWNRNKITAGLGGSRRKTSRNQNLDGKILITTPFKNYENMQVSSSLEMNENSYKINIDTQLPQRSTASLNSQGKMISINDVEINAVFIGHFPILGEPQRASIDFVHKLLNSKLRSTLDAAYGDSRLTAVVIGLTEYGYNSRNVEFSATINSPFNGFEEMKGDFAHSKRGYEYSSKLQLSKNRMSGSLTHKLSVRDMLNFETTLDMSSTSSIPSAKISIVQVNNGGQLEHNSYAEWDKNKRINLNAQYLDKLFLKQLTLKITTPYRKYREMEFKSTFEGQNWEYKGAMSAVWDRKNKITLSGDIRNYQWENVNAQLEFTSSFRGYEFYSASAKYDLTEPLKVVELSYLWDISNRKSVIAKGNLLYSYRLSKLEMELTTPFDELDRLVLSSKYENSAPEKSVSLFYEKGSQRVIFNGKTIVQRNAAEANFDYSSTLGRLTDMSALAKYEKFNDRMAGEVSTQWNGGNKYQAKGNYESRNAAATAKVSVVTPFRGYRNVNFEMDTNYGKSRKTAEFSLQWDNSKNIFLTGSYDGRSDNGAFNINIQTPFSYRNVNFDSRYKIRSGHYEGNMKATLNERHIYEGSALAKFGGQHAMEIKLDLNSPHSPFKNVQLSTAVDSKRDLKEVTASLSWENKEMNTHVLLKKSESQYYEAQMKIITPFEGFKLFSLESSLRNDNYEFMDARLALVTPFEALRNLNANGELKIEDSGSLFVINVITPEKSLNAEAKLSNRQFRPFTASLDINAPFMSFQKLSTKTEVNIIQWNNAKMNLLITSPKFEHTFETAFLQDNKKLNFVMKADSSIIPSKKVIIVLKADYAEPSKIETEASAELLKSVHYLIAQHKNTGRDMEFELRIESPLLPEKESQITASFSRRRNNKFLEGKLNFNVPSSAHEIGAKYESRGNQISSGLKVDSNFLTSSPLEAEAKYTNSNNRDIETSLKIITPETSHSIVGSMKNYDGEKLIQLKVDCPFVKSFSPFSVTGTLRNTNFETMDGSLSVTTPGKEIRIAGNMKNSGWKDVEAFVIINTPFEALRMFRLDGRFKNDRSENIECNFQMETSNSKLPTLGMTSKISHTKGSEEISLMLQLPIRNYRTIQLLTNTHYEDDFSSADSRITLSIPPKRYSIYGQYGVDNPRISGTAELEFDGSKWISTGRLEYTAEKKDVVFSITAPSSDRYSFGGAYGRSSNRHYVAASYTKPSNERYDINTTMYFDNPGNYGGELKLETPFRNYRNVHVTISQQYNSNYFSKNVEYIKNGRRGFLKVIHRSTRSGSTGSIQLGCPHEKLRDIKLSYNHLTKYRDQECSIELDYNRVKQFKAELMRFGEKSAHVILDAPVVPVTVTIDNKQLSNGREINFKSNFNSRIVGFRSSYQKDEGQFQHDASFAWDERAEKRVSYDFKLANTETGKELWSKLDTPLRSFMLKGNFTATSRVRSGGIDFFWDASKTLEKHMAMGISHTDISSGKQKSHRVQMVVEHPKIPRAVRAWSIITYSPSEFHVKNELHYSPQRHHNMLLEIRANDLSKSNRDSHYKGEFFLKHPISRLDIQASAELMDSKLESSAYAKLNSLDVNSRQQNVHELRAKLSKIGQNFDLTMRGDENQMSLSGQMTDKNGEVDVSVERKINERTDLLTNVKYNRRSKMLELSVTNAENTGMKVSSSFTKDFASFKVSHSAQGNTVTDINMFVGLEQSKILRSQLHWRPRMWEQLRINTGEYLRAHARANKDRYSTLVSAISEAWTARTSMIAQAVGSELSPFIEDVQNDLHGIRRDIIAAKNSFSKMYRNNEFYMKDIVKGLEVAKEATIEVIEGLSLACEVLCYIIVEYVEDMYYTTYYACLDLAEYLQKLHFRFILKSGEVLKSMKESTITIARYCAKKLSSGFEILGRKLQNLGDIIVFKLDKWLRKYAPCFIDGYYYTKNAADKIRYSVNDLYATLYDCIVSNRFYIAVKNYATTVMETIEAFRDYEYAETAQTVLSRIYDVQLLENIINHPNVEYMSGLANSALRKSVEVYHNLGLDLMVSSIIDSVSNYVQNLAFNSAEEFLAEFYHMKGGAKYDFAPERGYVGIEVNLPTTRNSLVEVFDFQSYPEYKKMLSMKNTLETEMYEDFCIWDFYYKFKKYISPSSWLPSFKAHALISGKQHYITFDKLPYEFAGRCSYLLARDFVDGNFSVIVNYGEDHTRKSLTVLTEGRKVDISHDYKITLDDVKAESPIQIEKTVVIREGPNIRIENEKKGFSIVCNFVHNYCTVVVSGFYFGKTGGLLGTYNYEPKLDFMTPTRHLAGDVESFTNSWQVGQVQCRSSENLATIPSNDYRIQEKCKSMFHKSSSEFRACFKQVDPETYLKMCINDLSAVHESRHDAALCQSAAAYFVECKMEGVPLKMPKHCVLCEKQDGSMMKEGEAVKFTRDDKVTAADVVFLVEEKQCNRDRVKYLTKLAQGIEENYKQKGYRDVRYSVVGFGGDEIHAAPHIHTMDGQESGTLRSLESALQSLEYGDGPINILEALRFAAALNFRPGTTKSFVLVKCSTCKSEELKAEYSEMLRTLIDGDISLHLLMEQRFEMKGASKNSKARKVIGVDRRFAYTLKDVKDSRLLGDGDLLAQLKIPKDVCIPLALEVNGSSFDAHFLTETKKNTNKKFMDVLARLVVRSSSEVSAEWGMCCECIATIDGVGKSTCQRCVSAEVASMISANTSGINNVQNLLIERATDSKLRRYFR